MQANGEMTERIVTLDEAAQFVRHYVRVAWIDAGTCPFDEPDCKCSRPHRGWHPYSWLAKADVERVRSWLERKYTDSKRTWPPEVDTMREELGG